MTVIDQLLQNNSRYADGFDKGELPLPPARNLAVVACMDARLDVHKILGLSEGDAHVIRNAGGVVSDDAIRSLVISQRLLGTTAIVLIHHTDCGMLTFRDDAVKDAIEADTGLRPAFAMEAFGNLEKDVRQSISRIQASPFIPHKDQVRGFVYDCSTGRLNEVSSRLTSSRSPDGRWGRFRGKSLVSRIGCSRRYFQAFPANPILLVTGLRTVRTGRLYRPAGRDPNHQGSGNLVVPGLPLRIPKDPEPTQARGRRRQDAGQPPHQRIGKGEGFPIHPNHPQPADDAAHGGPFPAPERHPIDQQQDKGSAEV